MCVLCFTVFFFKQKTAYEMRISDWSSDVCSSDLLVADLGIEMGVGGARLGHVGAPDQQEHRVVPVGALRHVGLLAEGLGRARRQVAVPVVEAEIGRAHV